MEFSRVVGEEILHALQGPFAPLVEFVRCQPSPRLFDLRLSRADNVLLYYAGYGALRIAPHGGGRTLTVGKSHSGPSGFDPRYTQMLWMGLKMKAAYLPG